jgi:membrane protein DedA with SNARE-associated domain
MPLAPCYFWTFLGSLIFCGGLVLAGHALGAHASDVIDGSRKYAIAIIALVIVAVAAYLFVKNRRTKNQIA